MPLCMRCSKCGHVADPAKLGDDDAVFIRLMPGRVTMDMLCPGCKEMMGRRKVDGLAVLALLMGLGYDRSPDGAGLAPLGMLSCMGCGRRFSPRRWGPDLHPRWRVTMDLQGGPFAMSVRCPRCKGGEAFAGPIVAGHRPEQVATMFIDVLLFVFPSTLGSSAARSSSRPSGGTTSMD